MPKDESRRPPADRRLVIAIFWSLALTLLLAAAGCDTIHGAGQVSSNGGSGAAAGITLPLPGNR